MSNDRPDIERRDFLKQGSAVAGVAAVMGAGGVAEANNHPNPNPGSMQGLDYNTYTSNCEVIAHYTFKSSLPPNPAAHAAPGNVPVAGKSNMWAKGKQRFLVMGGTVLDVTEPKKAALVKEGAFQGGTQLAYNPKLKKWVNMTSAFNVITSSRPDAPRGRHDDPALAERALAREGLRGVRLYDATDPSNAKLLSEWSCDQGDPTRKVQTGGGTHRNWYRGGQYAYLDTAADNSFSNQETGIRALSFHIQTIDVSDPAKPKFMSNWWFPGQRNTEMEEYKKWRTYGDKTSWTMTHGPCVTPVNVEDGGKYGYTAYGSFGLTVHDVSDPRNPKLVGLFDPLPSAGGIPFHTVFTGLVESRGIVITNPETLSPDCAEPWQDSWIIDVRDPTNPKPLARLPRPVPPPNAPYTTFCNKRGRTGTHNTPHQKAPGKVHESFTAIASFNGGIQMYDFSRLDKPEIVGYFVPPSGGALDRPGSWNRDSDNVFIEWDRNLIWAMTNTGMYLLTSPALGKPNFEPMAVKEWSLPGLNQGHEQAV